MANPASACPCGSGRSLEQCCGPRISGAQPAETAEALMRSRYSAFALGERDYLLRSWHPAYRPAQLELEPSVRWLGLKILACQAGGVHDAQGTVEFVARSKCAGRASRLHETSRFVREHAIWLYCDGIMHD